MTDEADSSVVLAELQVALFSECNNQRLSPWGRPFSCSPDPVTDLRQVLLLDVKYFSVSLKLNPLFLNSQYGKCDKYWDTQTNNCACLKNGTVWFCSAVMCPKDAD